MYFYRGPKYHLLAHTTLSLSHVQDSFRTHDLTISGNGEWQPSSLRLFSILAFLCQVSHLSVLSFCASLTHHCLSSPPCVLIILPKLSVPSVRLPSFLLIFFDKQPLSRSQLQWLRLLRWLLCKAVIMQANKGPQTLDRQAPSVLFIGPSACCKVSLLHFTTLSAAASLLHPRAFFCVLKRGDMTSNVC